MYWATLSDWRWYKHSTAWRGTGGEGRGGEGRGEEGRGGERRGGERRGEEGDGRGGERRGAWLHGEHHVTELSTQLLRLCTLLVTSEVQHLWSV